jgi:hypothetical protein
VETCEADKCYRSYRKEAQYNSACFHFLPGTVLLSLCSIFVVCLLIIVAILIARDTKATRSDVTVRQ